MRVRHRDGAVALRLFGRWTLLAFDAPSTAVDESGVLTSFAITGGLLARTPGGSITFSQSAPPHVQLRATIDGFFPRLGRRADGAGLDGRPLPARPATHPHRDQPPLLRTIARRRDSMRVVVFGATGTIGQALVPVLAETHEVVAVSRTQRRRRGRRDVGQGGRRAMPRRCAPPSPAPTSSTTSCTRSASSDFERRDREAARDGRARGLGARACAQIVYLGGLGDDSPELSPHLRSRIETGEALRLRQRAR